jgi:hypothetical protein
VACLLRAERPEHRSRGPAVASLYPGAYQRDAGASRRDSARGGAAQDDRRLRLADRRVSGLGPSSTTSTTQDIGGPGGATQTRATAREGANPAAEPLSAQAEIGGAGAESRIRIIANRRNNALLVYATPSEYTAIEGMLRKLDIIPLQVLIEATIAEVTLNDALNYGTQFYLGNKFRRHPDDLTAHRHDQQHHQHDDHRQHGDHGREANPRTARASRPLGR